MSISIFWLTSGVICLSFIFRFWPLLLSKLVSARKHTRSPVANRENVVEMIRCPSGNHISVTKMGLFGPPMIFLHGLLSGGQEWVYQAQYFADEYSVYIIDLPGHGLSFPFMKVDINVFAEDLSFILEFYQTSDSVLYGHSMGGMVILEYLKKNTDKHRIKSVILQHTTAQQPILTTVYPRFFSVLWKPLIAPFLKSVVVAPIIFIPASFFAYYSGISVLFYRYIYFTGGQSSEELNLMVSLARKSNPEAVAKLLLQMFNLVLERDLEKINIPTLIISGERDRVTIPAAGEFLNSKINDSVIFHIQQGHMSMMENPEKINHAIADFLKNIGYISN